MLSYDPIKAGKCIRNGGLVVFPTETVYGIGASAYLHEACKAIYILKNRPQDNPFIVHTHSIKKIQEIAFVQSEHLPLLQHFLPGPITFIFKKKDPAVFTSGLDTIAIRIPQLEIARIMIEAAGGLVAAPSANRSGLPSITRCHDAIAQFEEHVDMILMGPDCDLGIESTVVDLSGEIPIYLRPGMISYDAIKRFLPSLQRLQTGTETKIISPGLKYRHYAPACKVIMTNNMNDVEDLENSGQIGYKLVKYAHLNVDISDNQDYIHKLYAFFIDCDKMNLNTAYCEFPQEDEHQEALLNRLYKAASKK